MQIKSVLSFVVPDLITECFSIFENNTNQLWCIMSYFLDEYLLLILTPFFWRWLNMFFFFALSFAHLYLIDVYVRIFAWEYIIVCSVVSFLVYWWFLLCSLLLTSAKALYVLHIYGSFALILNYLYKSILFYGWLIWVLFMQFKSVLSFIALDLITDNFTISKT